MKFVKILDKILLKYSKIGEVVFKNKTKGVGHIPHIAPEAYLFKAFNGLKKNEIKALEQESKIKFHEDLKLFYSLYNGLNLFFGTLSIFGKRFKLNRDPNDPQPFNLKDANIILRLEEKNELDVIIGAYKKDGSRVMMKSNGSIIKITKNSYKCIKEWESLDEFLSIELKRLSELFDDKGRLVK